MKKYNAAQRYLIIGMLIALIATFSCQFLNKQWPEDGLNASGKIEFSQESGFYPQAITIELIGEPGTEIYYTLDGSEPDMDNPQAYLYQDGIRMEADEEESVCTIKAAAFSDGVSVSDMESRTYIMGVNVRNRYSIPVLSVSGSPDDFYDEKDGIMVFGQVGGVDIETNDDLRHQAGIDQLGNRYQKGREAEKEVFVTFFGIKNIMAYAK